MKNMTNKETGNSPIEPKLLRRSVDGRMFGGVASGFARYFNLDATLVRVIFVVLALLGGGGVLIYAASWLLIPEQGSDVAIASSLVNHGRTH